LTALFGPIFRKLEGVGKYSAFAICIFAMTFLLTSFVTPPTPQPLLTAERNSQLATGLIVNPNHLGTNNTAVFFAVRLINRGNMGSIAQDFQLTATVDGTDNYAGKFVPIPQVLSLPMPDCKIVSFIGGDALYNKALNTIPPGGSVTGILLYKFNVPRTVFENHETVFHLQFEDALDHIYRLELPLGTMPVREMDYIPGLNIIRSNEPQGACNKNHSP
jgi:hypothetical protein